ncbi:flagellin [Velocimicrobium porci]|nr:flagellin [Velocimicrobium porci]
MVESKQAETGKDAFHLQVGANAGQEVALGINSMKAKDLNIVQTKDGVEGESLKVTSQADASLAVKAYDMAIQKVSTERAKMGATQNRLEHTIANLDTSAENLQSAESRIRDVNMAKEMVDYSKNNILQQAAQSMLAQANQSTQGVLSLLR